METMHTIKMVIWFLNRPGQPACSDRSIYLAFPNPFFLIHSKKVARIKLKCVLHLLHPSTFFFLFGYRWDAFGNHPSLEGVRMWPLAAQISLPGTWPYPSLCSQGTSHSLNVVGAQWILLNHHMIVLFLIFLRNFILFPIVATPVYISTNRARGFPFLHILAIWAELFLKSLKIQQLTGEIT